MCNNVTANILKKEEVKRKEKDQISDWLEKRKCIRKNIYAKKMKSVENGNIIYSNEHPLLLHNGTEVHEIGIENRRGNFETVYVVYSSSNSDIKEIRRIKRYAKDTVEEIEKFLENSMSIQQLYNIDLNIE